MSWYLANEGGIIDQFASGQGLIDLRTAVDHGTYPALKDFFDVGATKNTLLCVWQLGKLQKMTVDQSVKDTAKGLAKMLRGQHLVSITQGTTGHDDDKSVSESSAPGRPLNHPDHARLIDPIKRRVKRIVARYFRRQETAILEDVRLRFHVGKEYKEAAGDKRAEELLPESLSPLNFRTTPKEDSEYLAAIRLAITRAEKQLSAELESDAVIPRTSMSKYLEDNSLSKLTGDFADTTKQRLRSAIADAVDAGGTADDIVGAIKDTMDTFSDARAELVAQTEVNDAYNFGRHELADAAGMTEKAWELENVTPCLVCIANSLQGFIPIEDDFLSGDPFPTAHPGCYCGTSFRLITAGEGK